LLQDSDAQQLLNMNLLKTTTLIQKNNNCLLLFLFFLFFGFNLVQSQVQNNGSLYIGDGVTLYIKSGNFNFGASSSTKTSRTASTFGTVQFGASVTHTGTVSGTITDVSNGVNQFVDGFVGSKSNSYFELPTGQSGTTPVYAPIGITNTTVTNGVSAAYYVGALINSSNSDSSIAALPSSGYWKVVGDNAKLTLLWSSDISSLSNTIANLTVAGYNISTNKWEVITSATPTGSLSSGSIQTSNDLTLASYSAVTIAKKGMICAPVFVASGTTKTWNGTSWSPSAPTDIDNAVISAVGAPGSFVCNTLAVNANITIIDGQTIEVVNAITGSGVITMSNQASILQRNDTSGISPTINLTKSTRDGMYAYDYIYWGSPLKQTEDSFSLLATARAYTIDNVSTSGLAGAFDNYFKYVAGDTTTSGGWQPLTSSPNSGIGFITRIKNQAPFATFGIQNTTDHINLTFTGTTNNGNISVPIANSLSSTTSARNYNLLSNPYPSAIDADKFLQYNTDLDGAIYLWKATTPSTGAPGSSYTSADYIAYTRAGYTAEAGVSSTLYNGKIASGQGFRVKSMTSSGTGTATFNNCMRISGGNNQFVRTQNTSNVDRFKLNLKGANGVGNQILVAYLPETTLEYDRMYDAELNSVSPAQIYSILDNTAIQLGINARPSFQTTDVVALGIDKTNTNMENFTIAITDKEGVFQSNGINVFLHDKALNVYRNLADSSYEFVSNTAQLQNRFEIVYQNSTLSNTDFESNNVIALIKNQTVKISASLPITDVSIYDISGRLVFNYKVNNLIESSNSFYYAPGIYIAKVKMNNGAVATVKLINN
jgi:hypothetical protein